MMHRCLLMSVALVAALAAASAGRLCAQDAAPPAAAAAGGAERAAGQPATAPETEPQPFSSAFDFLRKGGWVMVPICACSVIALAFVFERFVALRRNRIVSRTFFDEIAALVKRGEAKRAETACRERGSPLADLLRSVLLVEGGARAEMEASLESEGARVVWALRRNGKALGVIVSIAPLLGLLGTVWGMIRAFATFAYYARIQGIPPTEMLAKGIYEALITTVAGLVVAIPCLLFHHFFREKADTLVREMEDLALELINLVIEGRRRAPGPEGVAAP